MREAIALILSGSLTLFWLWQASRERRRRWELEDHAQLASRERRRRWELEDHAQLVADAIESVVPPETRDAIAEEIRRREGEHTQ